MKEAKEIIRYDQEVLDEILISGLEKLGLLARENDKIARELCMDFALYKDRLLEYNSHTNLTAITDEKEVYIKHFLDSLSAFRAMEMAQKKVELPEGASIIDVGTGAGFPSLPMKIMRRDLHLTLLDSLNKRIKFLQEVCESLELEDTLCLHQRAEEGARMEDHRESYDMAVSRAVAQLPALLEYCIPYVKVGGYFVCLKGPAVEDEIKLSERALKVLKSEIIEVVDVEIPHSELSHKVVIIRKNGKTDKAYPRKAGKPNKEPLI